MKKALRKLYQRELLYDFLMFGLLFLVWGGFLLFQLSQIVNGRVFYTTGVRLIGFSIAVLFCIILIAGISLYKKSMSYILWYKGILNSIPIPVIVTDKSVKVQRINKAAQNIMVLKQGIELEGLNCRHLIDIDGNVMKKIWIHEGAKYQIIGSRLYCDGKDAGYLILLNNNSNGMVDSCKTQKELIHEINRLLGRLSTTSGYFHDCVNTLAGCAVRQADIIRDLTGIITGIVSGALNETEDLNAKMHTVDVDIRQHMESNRALLEIVKRVTEEFNSIHNVIGDILPSLTKRG